jgi:hypothetical protein
MPIYADRIHQSIEVWSADRPVFETCALDLAVLEPGHDSIYDSGGFGRRPSVTRGFSRAIFRSHPTKLPTNTIYSSEDLFTPKAGMRKLITL